MSSWKQCKNAYCSEAFLWDLYACLCPLSLALVLPEYSKHYIRATIGDTITQAKCKCHLKSVQSLLLFLDFPLTNIYLPFMWTLDEWLLMTHNFSLCKAEKHLCLSLWFLSITFSTTHISCSAVQRFCHQTVAPVSSFTHAVFINSFKANGVTVCVCVCLRVLAYWTVHAGSLAPYVWRCHH